jgi:hypothetical protein
MNPEQKPYDGSKDIMAQKDYQCKGCGTTVKIEQVHTCNKVSAIFNLMRKKK